MQIWKARKVAQEITNLLSPYCHEIIVCGSIRRGKRDRIKDIDLVLLPIIHQIERQPSLMPGFEGEHVATTNQLTEHLNSREQIDVGIEIVSVGVTRHTLFHQEQGVDVELYCVTDRRQLGVAVAFRTGPAEFSARLAAFPHYLHWHITNQVLHKHDRTGKPGARVECKKGLACPLIEKTPEEADLFSALGLPYMAPEVRTPGLLIEGERIALNLSAETVWS